MTTQDQAGEISTPFSHGACIEGANARLAYIFAGKATFTLRSLHSGKHFTFRIREKENAAGGSIHFVDVLVGSDEYVYLGVMFDGGPLRPPRQRPITLPMETAAFQAFRWFQRNPDSTDCEVWHAGTCARCGKELTDPESIATGLGPVCRTK